MMCQRIWIWYHMLLFPHPENGRVGVCAQRSGVVFFCSKSPSSLCAIWNARSRAAWRVAAITAVKPCACSTPTFCSGPSTCTVHSLLMDTGGPFTALVPAVVPKDFEGLELGPLLGKGSYGRVYRGCYHGEEVAVKVPVCSFWCDSGIHATLLEEIAPAA